MNGIAESDVFGMMFHHFPDLEKPDVLGSFTAKKLDAIITKIGSKPILPAQEWLDRAARRSLSTGAICLTFRCVTSIPPGDGIHYATLYIVREARWQVIWARRFSAVTR